MQDQNSYKVIQDARKIINAITDHLDQQPDCDHCNELLNRISDCGYKEAGRQTQTPNRSDVTILDEGDY